MDNNPKCRLMSGKGELLMFADWERALFMHFEVDPCALQSEVPFSLDLREGKAYVSLVAFTMRRLRPRVGGRLAEWCFKPIATHELLNLRTYVQHRGEAGIYFLAEWIPNRLSAFLGPRTFGLPYRLGHLDYRHRHEEGILNGRVESTLKEPEPARLIYEAHLHRGSNGAQENPFRVCAAGSLDEFLLERYTAFTRQGSKARFFRIWHPPWLQKPVEVSLLDDSLLRSSGSWAQAATLVGANYSPGLQDVWMGRPHKAETCPESHSVLSGFFQMP